MAHQWKKRALTAIICIFFAFFLYRDWQKNNPVLPEPEMPKIVPAETDTSYKNTAYQIEGQSIQLTDGYSKATIEFDPESATTVETRYFGNPLIADFDGNSTRDALIFITQNPGGSGTFYYTALSLGTASGYVGKNSIYLGDRITPKRIEFSDGIITVTYLDRKQDAPMSSEPTIVNAKRLKIENGSLVELSQ